MSDCIFCKIVSGAIPASKVYEDEDCLAFLDIAPLSLGHTLAITKKHFETIGDIDEQALASLMKATKKIAKALLKEHEGVNIIQNNGRAAGQLVSHIHFHIVSRDSDDNVSLFNWQPKRKYTNDEIAKAQERIKSLLK